MTSISGPAVPSLDAMTWIGDYAREAAHAAPDRTAFVNADLGYAYSFSEFDRMVGRCQFILSERGLGAGDRIAYYGRNNDLYYAVLIAAIRLGIVLVPLNWRCVEPEIDFFIRDSGTRLILCDSEFMDIARSVAGGMSPAPDVMVVEAADGESLRALLMAQGPIDDSAIAWDASEVCLHMYTSGTTGQPKGVLSRHAALSISRFQELSWQTFPNWDGGTVVSSMPNFHIGGMSWVLMALLRKSTCVMTSNAAAQNILRLMVEHKAERSFAVPTVVRTIVDEARAANLTMPWLRTIYYGAAPMSPSLLADAIEVLGCSFGQFFGMTEITGTATFLHPDDHNLARPHLLGSVGRPYPGVDVEIRDLDGQPVSSDTAGEIWIRTPTVMKEYWHRAEATADVMIDGWYRSGDGGYLDKEGFLFLTDRIKDVIVSGGENVYPGEVEEALRRHPDVYEVAVVGVPHEKWGEAVAALVECTPGTTLDIDELVRFARTQVAPYKCPKHIEITQALPRTASGKIQRAAAKKFMTEIRQKTLLTG